MKLVEKRKIIPSQSSTIPSPLEGLLVVEVADELVAYCGRLLASLGAEVVLVEPPGGCLLRHGTDELAIADITPSFAWLHTGKSSIVIDPTNDSDLVEFKSLIARADIVLQGPGDEWDRRMTLACEGLPNDNPRLVVASILPFGSTGPYRNYRSTKSVDFAMSGLLNLSGKPEEPPVLAPCNQSTVVAGAQASVGILIAIRVREQTGLGQCVEVSVQEAFTAQENIVSSFTGDGWRGERTGSQHRVAAPGRIYPCNDGFVHLFVSPVQKGAWDRLLDWMGSSAGILSQEEWSNPRYRRSHVTVLDEVIRDWTRTWQKQDLYIEAQKRHIPCAPVNSMADFVRDPQTVSRGFFQQARGNREPTYIFPSSTILLDGVRRHGERRAPELGVDNSTYLSKSNRPDRLDQ